MLTRQRGLDPLGFAATTAGWHDRYEVVSRLEQSLRMSKNCEHGFFCFSAIVFSRVAPIGGHHMITVKNTTDPLQMYISNRC
jgi:hypothetical protein